MAVIFRPKAACQAVVLMEQVVVGPDRNWAMVEILPPTLAQEAAALAAALAQEAAALALAAATLAAAVAVHSATVRRMVMVRLTS